MSAAREPGRVVPAPLLVLGGIGSVQVGAAVAKRLFAAVGPAGAVLLRLAIAAAILLAVLGLRGLRRDAGLARGAGLGLVVLFGLVLAAMNLAFYEAIARIPLGVAVTVEFTGPLGVAVAGSRRLLDGLWVLFAGTGVVLLAAGSSTPTGAVDPAGVLFALLAGGFWAAYILLSQRVGRAMPGAAGLAWALLVGAIVMAPVGVAAAGRSLLQPGVLGTGAAVAVLSSAIPYSLELAALRRLSTAVFGVLMSLEPAVAALAGFVVLAEPLLPRQIFAIILVSLASAGATLARRPATGRAPAPTPLTGEPGGTP